MCGIVGFNGSDAAAVRRATETLAHRGPDDAGVFVDAAVSLGHRRLSILDLTPAGHQPMFYRSDTGATSAAHHPDQMDGAPVGIVFNGEIYNHLELREQLQRLGHTFTTRCDTETVLAAYLAWGTDAFPRFNGMWALAIYDRSRQELLLARDRLGIKPLYVADSGGRLVFGSELKVFVSLLGRLPPDPDALAHYAAFGFTPPDRALPAGVGKLLPGEWLRYDLRVRQTRQRERFWTPPWPAEPPPAPGPDPRAELRACLDAAVRRRLLADVPVGAFLSGGVDSSIIVALMRPHVRDLKTFSVRFDHPAYDESRWSRLMAERLETDHYELPFDARAVRDLLPKLTESFDDPLGDSSMVPTYLVSGVARRHVAVSLSGTGGDELFAGYPRFAEYLLLERLRRWPALVTRGLTALYARMAPDRAQKLAGLLSTRDPALLYALLFSHRFRAPGPPPVGLDRFPHLALAASPGDPLKPMLDFEQRLYLPEDLLVKEDRASMAHGLEARVPFLDYTVVALANGLHHSWKRRGRVGKFILKSAFADVLPAAIAQRPKRGFGFPLAEYLRGDLRETVREILFDPSSAAVLDRTEVDTLWTAHQSGRSDYAHSLWSLMMLALWRARWSA